MENSQFTRIGTFCDKCGNVICECNYYQEEMKNLNGFNDGLHNSSGIGGGKPYFEKIKDEQNIPILDESAKERERLEAEMNYRYGGNLKKSIEVLCNALREDTSEGNWLKPQMLNTKKLEILKTVANLMGIDWDVVEENSKIINLNLRAFKPINK